MCGIFGIVCDREKELGEIMVEACKRLSYRGYDSVGCATIRTDKSIDLRKDVGKVDDVAQKLNFFEMKGVIGIAQLRWATFGAPSKVNAQPHLDSKGYMVGAHNGNIVNNIQLRELFLKEGMKVRSTNDGESCVHSVEYFFKKGFTFEESVRKSVELLEGDYSYLISNIKEDKIYAVKKGSGLVVGVGNGFNAVSSDLPSLLFLTKKVIKLDDGEMAILEAQKVTIKNISDGRIVEREIEEVKEEMESVKKGGFPHFMLKEIYEQPKVSSEVLHLLKASPLVEKFISRIKKARNLYFIGCGTSFNACLYGAVAFAKYGKRAVIPVIAPQFIPQYLPTVTKEDVGVFVSQSGETKDVLRALAFAKEKGMAILGLVNVLGSTLMKESEVYLPIACGYEISVPATKTFINQMVVFLYLAIKFCNGDTSILEKIPEVLEKTIETSDKVAKEILPLFKNFDEFYCLGYGLTYPIALEGALKLKEVTYSHCEGMLSTEFKHGPLSSVRKNYPILFISSYDDIPQTLSGINEVSCRGGFTVVISSKDERVRANANKVFEIPIIEEPLFSVASIIPLQLLSYYLSLEKGIDPDFPRNLSKTLTVD